MRPSGHALLFVVFASVTLATASCSSGATSTTTPSTSTTSTSSTTTTVAAAGCTSGSADVPEGATSRQVGDLDGDGRPDTVWINVADDGTTTVGVVTAAGGGTERTWESASPVERSVLVAQINDSTPPLFLADDGRTVDLWAFDDCSIADVLNVQGQPYQFSLGFTDYGTGVGCATIDGVQQLVGFNVTNQSDQRVDWTQTVVTVHGTEARNGTETSGTYTSPADDAQIQLLHTVSCGALTITNDGISAQE